jgi:ABC-type branched-subunit amino acid transport system ATPase component
MAQGLVREKKCVTLTGLRKEFPGGCGGTTKVAVDGVDLVLTEGSITVLLGHNGAGVYCVVATAQQSACWVHGDCGLTGSE